MKGAIDRLSAVAALLVAIGWPAMAFSDKQIPERAAWEITFAQVEAAAGWPDLRTASPGTFEARVMDRAPQAMAPVPFLRVVRTGGAVRAELFVFWGKYLSPSHQPQGNDVRCRDSVCVKPIDLVEQRDWEKVLTSLARQSGCPGKYPPETVRTPDGGLTSTVRVCPHCPMVFIKSAVDGKYREQVCADPLPDSDAGRLRALMIESARVAGR